MLSKGTELPRPPPTHPEETEEELTETNDMQEDEIVTGLHRCNISVPIKLWSDHCLCVLYLCNIFVNRLQKDGSDDSTHSSERLGVPAKGDEEYVHIKGESTESELDEEEEDEDSVQLREVDEDDHEGYKVCTYLSS